jgi:hypothetical protein
MSQEPGNFPGSQLPPKSAVSGALLTPFSRARSALQRFTLTAASEADYDPNELLYKMLKDL